MDNLIKIIIADDHQMLRKGIEVLLLNQQGMQIVAQAENGADLVQKVVTHSPDVVITDIQMPVMNGIEATRQIMEMDPGIGVIGLSMFNEDHMIMEMMGAGARGYLLKNTNRDELVTAIHTVAGGGSYVCGITSGKLSRLIATSKEKAHRHQPDFTEKEKEVIRLICHELSSKQIAATLGCATRTVESYRERIQEKIGARNMAGIVVFAIKHKIYEP